jgi:hypothetical protein
MKCNHYAKAIFPVNIALFTFSFTAHLDIGRSETISSGHHPLSIEAGFPPRGM